MLSIRNIEKKYGDFTALDDVSIEVKTGEIFGLLGPNGAGKTSLIRIINQITGPDSGSILFDGQQLNQSHIERIGYLPEERGLYKKMEIGEQLVYLARLKGLSREEARRRIKYWFEKLDMQSWWNKKVEELSKGMQQKVQFVSTVLHQPELIILDEPFSGFDPVNTEIIKNEILELNEKGATIIFSTHRMESVEELCDAIALINKSKKILDGEVKAIKNEYRNNTYLLEYEGEQMNFNGAEPFDVLEELTHDDRRQIKVQLKEGSKANDVLKQLIPLVNITRLEEVVPTMNEIFIKTVKQIH